jgi:hypothetical protein
VPYCAFDGFEGDLAVDELLHCQFVACASGWVQAGILRRDGSVGLLESAEDGGLADVAELAHLMAAEVMFCPEGVSVVLVIAGSDQFPVTCIVLRRNPHAYRIGSIGSECFDRS